LGGFREGLAIWEASFCIALVCHLDFLSLSPWFLWFVTLVSLVCHLGFFGLPPWFTLIDVGTPASGEGGLVSGLQYALVQGGWLVSSIDTSNGADNLVLCQSIVLFWTPY
jgi:hypothetical protein